MNKKLFLSLSFLIFTTISICSYGYITPTSGGVWGSITGTLSDQVDLTDALLLKAPAASPTFSGTITTPLTPSSVVRTDGSSRLSAGQVDLASQVSGNLPAANLNSGTNASSVTFWRGDGTWAAQASVYTTLSFLASNANNGSYVNLGNNLGFEKTDAFSLVARIYPATTTGTHCIVCKQAPDASAWCLFVESNQLFFEEYASGGSSNAMQVHGGTLSPNNWYTVSSTTDGTGTAAGTHLYINGVDQSLTIDFNNLSATIQNSANALIGGNPSFNEGFSGLITNVGVYSSALNQSAETAIYNGGSTINLTTLPSNSTLTHFYRLGNGDNATASNGFIDSKGSVSGTGAGTFISAGNIVNASPDNNSNGDSINPTSVGTNTSENFSAQSDIIAGRAFYLTADKAQGAISTYNDTFSCLYWGGIGTGDCIVTWQAGSGFPLVTFRGGIYPFGGDNTGHVGTIASDHYGQGRFAYGAFTTLYSWGNQNAAAQTTITGAAGTAVCSQPEKGPSYKKVVCALTGFSNTSDAYTFPVAFSATPYVYGTTGSVAVSGATTTALTFTSSVTQTGFVFVEGF